MEAAPLWSYASEMQTYVHRHAWKLHHCGVTPLWCRHTTTRMHGSCTAEALNRYGADIRPQGCTKAAPLRRYTAMVQTYDRSLARVSIRCTLQSTVLAPQRPRRPSSASFPHCWNNSLC